MLLDLQLRTNQKHREKWEPCTCPLGPINIDPITTWQRLLRINKQPRQTTIQDINYLTILTDIEDSTSEEEEKPRQNPHR